MLRGILRFRPAEAGALLLEAVRRAAPGFVRCQSEPERRIGEHVSGAALLLDRRKFC